MDGADVAGRHGLAVTTATRLQELPEILTVDDFLPGYEASAFWGIGAPKATPADIVDKLNKEINAALWAGVVVSLRSA